MNKLQQLEAKIQEAVPDIMKLQLGCKLKVNREDLDSVASDDFEQDYLTVHWYQKGGFDEQDTLFTLELCEWEYEFEILGRPITLEDVLMAIDISKKKTPLVVGINGEFSEEIQNGWKGHETWKLGSPLQDQSEETIDFLHSLIVKE